MTGNPKDALRVYILLFKKPEERKTSVKGLQSERGYKDNCAAVEQKVILKRKLELKLELHLRFLNCQKIMKLSF